ncbi:hypothetical protein HG1285_18879 [Hydrogenivirga sp. 128-5-R1-1]|nr:hypothetical protein HG1285_18879 [Hydrogenivirga sp. 128-5-R1-1]
MLKTDLLKERLSRLKQSIGGYKPSEFLPLDFSPPFGKVETKENLARLIASLDDYEFSKFVFLFKFWVMGEKDSSIWSLDWEREVFKGESNPVKRLERLLEFYGCTRRFELYTEDLENTLRLYGEKNIDRLLIAHKKVILYHGWHVDKEEGGLYVFRRGR